MRLRIGVALQDAALDDRQTGRELLTLQGRLYGLRSHEIRTRLDQVLDLVDIGSSIDRLIGTYSGGMKRQARPGGGARAQPRDPLSGRAHDRARPGEPRERLGRGAEAQRRARHDDLPHDPVPRGGRRARATGSGSSPGAVSSAVGAPDELKRSIGQDLIVAELQTDSSGEIRGDLDRRCCELSGALDAIDAVSMEDGRLVLLHLRRAGCAQPRRGRPRKGASRGEEPHTSHADPRRRLPGADRFADIENRRGVNDEQLRATHSRRSSMDNAGAERRRRSPAKRPAW